MSSCLPFILLSSIPLTQQSQSSYSKPYNSQIELSQPGQLIRTSRVEKPLRNESDSVPRSRRLETYESRMNSTSNEFPRLGDTGIGTTPLNMIQITPETVPLKFEFRSSREHEALVLEAGKGRGEKRVLNLRKGDRSTGNLMGEGLVEGDHILPFPSSYLSQTCASNLAGPSGSTSHTLQTTAPIKRPTQLACSDVNNQGERVQTSRLPVIARPSPSRPTLLPSPRGQAADRPISRRATSFCDVVLSLDLQDLVTTGVPMHEKIKIESLRRNSRSTKRDSAIGMDPTIAGGMKCFQYIEENL